MGKVKEVNTNALLEYIVALSVNDKKIRRNLVMQYSKLEGQQENGEKPISQDEMEYKPRFYHDFYPSKAL